MGSESPARAAATLFNVLERLVLFALSLSVGLLNLLIGLAVASRLGILPKKAAERVNRLTDHGTDFVIRLMEPSHPAASKRKAKPKP